MGDLGAPNKVLPRVHLVGRYLGVHLMSVAGELPRMHLMCESLGIAS